MSEEVLVKFVGNTKDLDDKTKSVNKSLSAVANGVKKAFQVSAVAIGVTATAIGALVKQSVDAYAEFEQLEGGLESLFGKGSEEMNRVLGLSESAWEKLTMSQNEYLNAFQSAYPLVNAGLSENADSIEYTNKMLQISSDLFNTYGGSVEQYQNAINWALKGSFVYLDNLNIGIKGTQEGFVEAANASGILGREIKNVKELTSDEIIDVIQHYTEAYGVWGKTAEEASKTIQGSLKMTKATWSNLIAGFSKDGADMNKLIDNFIKSAMTFGKNLLPVIERALSAVGKALPSLINKIGELLPGLLQTLLPILINGAVSLVNALIPQIPMLIQTIMPPLLDGVMTLIKSIATMLPQIITTLIQSAVTIINAVAKQLPSLMPLIVNAIIDGILAILDDIDLVIDCGMQLLFGLVDGLMEAIPVLLERAPEIIEKLISKLIELLPKMQTIGPKLILKLGDGILNALPSLITQMPRMMSSIIKGLASGVSGAINVGKNIVQGLWNGISGLKDWVINKVKGMGKAILEGIKKVLGIKSPSKEFAIVGRYSVLGYTEALDDMTKDVQGQIAETFSISPQMANSSSLHYSPNVNVTTINNISQDPLGRMVNDIKTFSGGAKNDYNYGTGVS